MRNREIERVLGTQVWQWVLAAGGESQNIGVQRHKQAIITVAPETVGRRCGQRIERLVSKTRAAAKSVASGRSDSALIFYSSLGALVIIFTLECDTEVGSRHEPGRPRRRSLMKSTSMNQLKEAG